MRIIFRIVLLSLFVLACFELPQLVEAAIDHKERKNQKEEDSSYLKEIKTPIIDKNGLKNKKTFVIHGFKEKDLSDPFFPITNH